ncbi:Aste57867_23375 [Aphanomyces stellatus]|uniref:DNA-directed primase/polymerase protein n=1 Tax=Aphanomyces stellatus TaxID=120398 RepID=A0A485LML3_9STRA|nr:hypothetical protein As57867_023304 [Aphanomyces stellatus]VFU00021.1 Aste57867_23375 [Aphanomyces stellatus]
MSFHLRLAIDDEDVGLVDAECNAAKKEVHFRMGDRVLVLLEHHITSFVRPVSISNDGSQFTILTALSQKVRPRFRCSYVALGNAFALQLQTAFPLIPWRLDDKPSRGLGPLRKRPREEASAPSFYGMPPVARLNPSFEAEFQYRLQHSVECQIEGTAKAYQVFGLQQPAIDFLHQIHARRSIHNIKLFSFETKVSRKFLVADVDLFYDMYSQTPPNQRHVYEIIQENSPCRLYFDLEFKPRWNPTVEGDSLVRHLKHLVVLQFYRKFGIKLSLADFVDLASTASDKFSRHVLVLPPNGALFANNLEAGQFVNELIDDVLDPEMFTVTGKDDTKSLFIDTGVYTRNRAFRLYLSSKYKSTRILERQLPTTAIDAASEKAFFLQTLVCPVGGPSKVPLLRCPIPQHGKPQFSRNRMTTSHQTSSSAVGNGNTSPFPVLDAFVRSLATQGGPQGDIRSWQLVDEADTPAYLTFHMVNNRFCRNVGRAHKSNNVMYVVDFARRHVYQKCHDPDCLHYKSPPMALPPDCCDAMGTKKVALSSDSLVEGFAEVDDVGRVQHISMHGRDGTQDGGL